jgi:hypothetical protein
MVKVPFSIFRSALKLLWDIWGIDYQLGVEVKPGNLPTAKAIDCSELVERVYRDGIGFILVDGADAQYRFCKVAGKELGPDDKPQPLDLIFLWDRDRIGQHIGHVALVFGEVLPVGGVLLIEARGKPWSHVMFTPLDKFKAQFGVRVAGMYRLVEPESLREPDKA